MVRYKGIRAGVGSVLVAAVLTACGTDPANQQPPQRQEADSVSTSNGPAAEVQANGPAAELVKRYVEAINAKDLDAYVALFNEDATFVDAGRRFTGMPQIRRFGERLINDDSHYVIVELNGEGDEANLVFDYTAIGGGYRKEDGTGELTSSNGLISALRLD
jgi:ketosteroid isomerase-like protein